MRKLVGLGALALVAPLLWTGSGPVAGASAAPAAKEAFVRYGDGPVMQDSWDQPVRLTFEAVAGDLVSVASAVDTCENIELTGPTGEVGKSDGDFHVIPSTGSYTFEYDQECRYASPLPVRHPVGVQLLKGRVVPVTLDAGTVQLPADQGYVDIARVEVRKGQGPVVLEANGGADHTQQWSGVFEGAELLKLGSHDYPLAHFPSGPGPDVVIEQTGRVRGLFSGPVQAGESLHFYSVGVARRVRLVPLEVERVAVDGDRIRVSLGDTRRIRFRGEAGQWIRLAGGAYAQDLRLGLGPVPSRGEVRPELFSEVGSDIGALWRLPADGRYSLDVLHAASHSLRPAYSLQIQTVRKERKKALDLGDDLRVALRPGRWALHRVRPWSEGPAGYPSSLEVTNAVSGGWVAVLLGGAQGSGDYGAEYGCVTAEGHVSADVARADWVLVVPGRRRGSLRLALHRGFAEVPREKCPGSS